MTEGKKRATIGEGSIIKNQGGWQWWYDDPITGKRKAKMLKVIENGKKRNPANITEAKEARDKLLGELADLNAIKTTEQAQLAIATSRKLIATLTYKPADIWEKYTASPIATDRPERIKLLKQTTEKFVAYCKEKKIETIDGITPEVCKSFIEVMAQGKSNRTYNEYLAVMKQVLEATYKILGMAENPFYQLRAKTKQTISREAYTPEQVEAICNAFENGFKTTKKYIVPVGKGRTRHTEKRIIKSDYEPLHREQLYIATLLGLYAGFRLVDACTMSWKEVDLAKKLIRYIPDKTKESSGMAVSVPIVATRLLDGLKRAQKWKDETGYVIPAIAEWYNRNNSSLARTFTKCFCAACGIEEEEKETEGRARAASIHGFHALRHTFVSIGANAGVPLETMASIVGHSTINTTQIYTHIADETKTRELEKALGEKTLKNQIIEQLEGADDETLNKILKILKKAKKK
ncbi:MAG: tyrosine-type recombinase/integrase [Victivallales bacterium]|nr:tyrosine-type recombinase/integrase [Victivallales bacterium]